MASPNADSEGRYCFYTIRLPGRANVREPLSMPQLEILETESGDTFAVRLSEAQLLGLLINGVQVLDQMRQRGATERTSPNDSSGSL